MNCDDLRLANSQLAQKQALKVRDQQMVEVIQKTKELAAEKLRDDQLWEEDRQRKIAREEADQKKQREKTKETMAVLSAQLERRLLSEAEARKKQSEQAALLKEEMQKHERASKDSQQKKRIVQQSRAKELDLYVNLRREKMQREREEELKVDRHLLARATAGMESTAKAADEKRQRLKLESKMYQDYIVEMGKFKALQEQELEDILSKEKEKVWQVKLAAMEKQVAARRKMMAEVLSIRQQQIQAKVGDQQHEAEINLKEADVLKADVELARSTEEARQKKIDETRIKYKSDLDAQICFNKHHQELDKRLVDYEHKQAEINEAEYQRRLKMEIDRMMGTV